VGSGDAGTHAMRGAWVPGMPEPTLRGFRELRNPRSVGSGDSRKSEAGWQTVRGSQVSRSFTGPKASDARYLHVGLLRAASKKSYEREQRARRQAEEERDQARKEHVPCEATILELRYTTAVQAGNLKCVGAASGRDV